MSESHVRKLGALAVVAVLTCTQYGCATPTASPDATGELLALNQSYDEALVEGDPVVLDRLYADDFEYIGPGAVVRNKQQQIESFASGAIDLLEGKSTEVTLRQYGETVVLTGRFKGKVRAEGREYSFSERYSTVWVQDRGDWKMVLEHGTVIPDP